MKGLVNFPKGHKALYVLFGVPYLIVAIVCDWWLAGLNLRRATENWLELVVLLVIIFIYAWSLHFVIRLKEQRRSRNSNPAA
jgi:hypothetical protein